MQRETVFKRRVQADLKALGGTWQVKTQQVSVRGIPDILGCVSGIFIALELKADEDAEIAPLQIYQIDQIRKAGGFAEVTWPDKWPDTFKRIRALVDKSGQAVR